MTVAINTNEFSELRDFLETQCGIALDESKTYLVESRLTQLLLELGYATFSELNVQLRQARHGGNKALVDQIVDAMTTNETYWFRDGAPYDTLMETILPEFEQQLASGQKKKIRIWSSACSTGQEPYSIAILIHELARKGKGRRLLENVEILATDISRQALMLAKSGRYNRISMARGIEDEFKQRYFENTDTISTLKPDIKNMVTLKQFNLQDPFTTWGNFDLILMRNVAIYFSRDFKKSLYTKVAQTLNPGGYFMLGSSEFLMDCQELYERQTAGRCSYYRVKK
ncbi:MAG: protein-glutamate O-methyltransferase CheR [Vampirovibrionales bacterium]|nr:protein-glutamate O-methyltransferase CheR [Vampirovibrionales bacterium]